MLSCKEATRLISESQERKLSLLETVPLRFHLMMCTGCHNFSKQIRFLREAMRAFTQWKGDEPKK